MPNLSSTKVFGNLTVSGTINASGMEYTAPDMVNGWENYSGSYSEAGYIKVAGVVYLRGLIRNGSNSTIFTLPSGYRPKERRLFATITSGSLGRVDINDNGDVSSHSMNSSNWLSLEGLCFLAEQ